MTGLFSMARAAVITALIVMAVAWHYVALQVAKTAATNAERLIWMEARARDLAKAADDRRKAETRIAAIEADYLAQKADDAAAIQDLEKAIADDAISNPVDGSGNLCRPVFSRQLRDKIDAIGRH